MFLIIFGKQYEDYFSTDIGIEIQETLMNYLSVLIYDLALDFIKKLRYQRQ